MADTFPLITLFGGSHSLPKAQENAIWNHTNVSISGKGCIIASYEAEEGEP